MFPLGTISILGSVLLIVVVGCLALKLGAKLIGLVTRMVPLTLLGVVAIVAGVWLFTFHPRVQVDWDDDGSLEERLERKFDEKFDGDFDFDRFAPEVRVDVHPLERMRESRSFRALHDVQPSRWVMVVLGTILVISGSMLARRGRVRPARSGCSRCWA